MSTSAVLSPKLYFSYSQFMIYDRSVKLPGCDWTERHTAQGFARRESTVNFGTLLEFGHSDVTVTRGSFQPDDLYERVIGVPFLVSSGTITVDGPDEMSVQRGFSLPVGNYWLVAAQQVLDDDQERIDLFFDSVDKLPQGSRVIIADSLLTPRLPLLETAGVAGA